METLSITSLMILASLHGAPQEASKQSKPVQTAVACFKTGEETSGMNKICYYNCLGSRAAITISSVSLCPLTIEQ
jgi:hypothetical protein